MSVIDLWESAVDELVDALDELKASRGTPAAALAQLRYQKALKAFDEASEQLG